MRIFASATYVWDYLYMNESRGDEPVALFGANQRRFREAYGWSQSELARRMVEAGWPKYSQVAVSRTEEGARAVRLDEAVSIARLFNRKLQDLLDPKDVIDAWQKLRYLMDDYSNSVTVLRRSVREIEDHRLFLAVTVQMLRDEIAAAGGPDKISETMAKTLANAERMLSRSTLDLVEGTLEEIRVEATQEDGEADGEHSEEA
jgi:transcriptional regulator with XRE-family HTH domain